MLIFKIYMFFIEYRLKAALLYLIILVKILIGNHWILYLPELNSSPACL